MNQSGDRAIYLVHSFTQDGSICFDNRLDVTQTEYSPNTEIEFRSFKFTTDGTDGDIDKQKQRISCILHLNPLNSASNSQSQANSCSCYYPNECAGCTPGYDADYSNGAPGICIDINECDYEGDDWPCPSANAQVGFKID